MDMSKEQFCIEIYRKNALPESQDIRFICEPAKSKRRETFHKRFHKSHFVWKFTWNMPPTDFAKGVLRKFTGKKRAVEIYKFTGDTPFIDSADGILYGFF